MKSNLPNRLRTEINKKGYSCTEFAKETNIALGTLSRILNGKQKITEQYAIKAAKILDVSSDYLLGISRPVMSKINDNDKAKIDEMISLMQKKGISFSEKIIFSHNNSIDFLYVKHSDGNYVKETADSEYELKRVFGQKIIYPDETIFLTEDELIKEIQNYTHDIFREIHLYPPNGGKGNTYQAEYFFEILLVYYNFFEQIFLQLAGGYPYSREPFYYDKLGNVIFDRLFENEQNKEGNKWHESSPTKTKTVK